MTRRNTRIVVAAMMGGGSALWRGRRVRRAEPLETRGMCFRLATLADVDADRHAERVVL